MDFAIKFNSMTYPKYCRTSELTKGKEYNISTMKRSTTKYGDAIRVDFLDEDKEYFMYLPDRYNTAFTDEELLSFDCSTHVLVKTGKGDFQIKKKADWERRLESIVTSSSRILRKTVQNHLLNQSSSSLKRATNLLRIWESYEAKAKKCEEKLTLSAATKNFISRLSALKKVLENLEQNKTVTHLLDDVNSLQTSANKEGGLNTGGTFEWVDSVLVKCLREGRWLLIDNANLCSPAVLDRLNSLLEPNGELVLGERGVTANGQLHSIKPHPQFRLFLTMDPRYGEISRAMRNRGVEIYMLESEKGNIPLLDLKALLDKNGVKYSDHQDVLLDIHNAVRQLTQGPEQPNINQLLHAASLISRHWMHGESFIRSFKIACKDVYVQNQHLLSTYQKSKINDTIQDIITSNENKLTKFTLSLQDCFDFKLTTYNMQQESSLYMLKWEGELLSAIIKTFLSIKSNDEILLKDILGNGFFNDYKNFNLDEKYLNFKLVDIIPNLLIYFYSCVTRRNVPLQNSYLKNIIENFSTDESNTNKNTDLILHISSELESKLVEFLINTSDIFSTSSSLLEQSDLPWDARRLPNKFSPKTSYSWSSENRMIALMNYMVKLIFIENIKKDNSISSISVTDSSDVMDEDGAEQGIVESTKTVLKWKTLSVLEYSSAVKEGRLSGLVGDEPIITELSVFLSTLDSCFMTTLQSNKSVLPKADFHQLLSSFEWRRRIFDIGQMVLFRAPTSSRGLPQVSENVKTLLALHYKWLSKSLLPILNRLIKCDSSLNSTHDIRKLMKIVSDVEKSLHKCASPLLSLAKKVRQISGQPLPLVSKDEAEIALFWDKLSRDASLSKPCVRKTDFENRVAWVISPEGRKCRILLLEAKSLLLNGQELKRVSELLEDVKSLLIEANLFSDQTKLVSKVLPKRIVKSENLPEIKLWPVHDLISLKLNTAMRKHLIENASFNKSKNLQDDSTMEIDDPIKIDGTESIPRFKINEAFCNWSKWLQTFPPGILALIYKVNNQQVVDKPIAYHQQVASILLEQFNKATAVKNTNVWIHWADSCPTLTSTDEEMLESDEYINDSRELRNILSPLLSQSVVSLVLPESGDSSAMESLRAHQDRAVLLNALKTTLWRNLSVLSVQQLNYLQNEETCIRKSFQNFTSTLDCSLQSKGYLNKQETGTETDFPSKSVIDRLNSGLNKLVKVKESKKIWYKRPSDANDPIDCLPQTLSSVYNSLNEINSTNDEIEKWILIGQSWAYLGLAQLVLFSCVDIVDPVHKNALKLQYATEEREHLERVLCVENVQCILEGRSSFPFKEDLKTKCDDLIEKETELKKFVAVRPDPPLFTSLIRDLIHATNSLCSVSNVNNILKHLVTYFYQWDKGSSDKVLNETIIWIQSIDAFASKFSGDYGTWYPDITAPILVAIAQIKYGIQLMFSTVKKLTIKQEAGIDTLSTFSLDTLLSLLASYPLPEISSALQLIEFCTSDVTLKLLKMAITDTENEDNDNKPSKRNETFRLAKFCLEEIQNIVKIKGNISSEWSEICHILDFVVLSWERQEDERKQKLLAEESLYINKPKIKGESLTEEQEIEYEIMHIFNPNREKDFSDIEKPISFEDQNKKPTFEVEPEDKLFKLTLKDIQDIHQIHFELVYENTKTHWLTLEKKLESALNFTSPFLERFTVFKMLLNKFGEACNIDLDLKISPGLCLATNISSLIGHCESTEEPIKGKHYDFYNDSHISEVKQCSLLLNKLTESVEKLRDEWPDHPTLNQIMIIVNRVMSFEATSPISRFLTGLELLMAKMREWEENAHSGVSLASHMSTLTQQVVAWRKLELSCWKGCLLATRNRLKGEVSKWWFYLYSLITGFLRNKSNSDGDKEGRDYEVINDNDLIKALQKFMEKSTLVQFSSRLQLLLNFHCHAANLTCPGHYELTNIFWNLYQYYKQFKIVIERHIQETGVTIEKKLKDFVKIARWNEISYWSVKENVDRNYRTLHKYIKEYETILNEPAVNAMTKIEGTSEPQKSASSSLTLSPDSFITNAVNKRSEDEKLLFEKSDLLNKDVSFLRKAKGFCKTIIQNSSYTNLVQIVDEFTGEIIATSQQLRDLQVDRTLPKDKQKSQAKNFLQQKRRSLAELFKMLANIGLSYRTGVILQSADTASLNDHFILPPLDVNVALESIDKRSADKNLLSIWDGCEKHFWHAVARSAQLKLTSQCPHKELGPPNIERCRGFTNHLMKLTIDQKKSLAESMQSLYLLRCQSVQLNEDNGKLNLNKNEEETLLKLRDELYTILNDSVYCLEQFTVLLQACPNQKRTLKEDEVQLSSIILDESLLGPMLKAFKGDNVWETTKTKLNECVNTVRKVKSRLEQFEQLNKFVNNLIQTNPKIFNNNKINETLVSVDIITYNEFIKIKELIEKLKKFSGDLKCIKKLFDLNVEPVEKYNPFVECFNKISLRLEKNLDNLESLYTSYNIEGKHSSSLKDFDYTNDVKDYQNKIENFINKILISIQEIYKKYKLDTTDEKMVEGDEDESSLQEGHLKKKIIESIYDDMSKLNLKAIAFDVQSLIQFLNTKQESDKNVCKRLLKHCGPLFDQFVLLVQFIVTQQLSALRASSKLCSVLLSLFIDLTQKGFCTPEDLLEEIEGEGVDNVAGGMGLGEGEGQKDVSDEIESQDQLEDARPRGEQREEEDKECKEEEKGIEMSDDFGGKLQDVEKEDNENETDDDSEKEEEPEKEMGDTEQGAETIDQQIWGSDSEDEQDEDDKDQKEEEGNQGEQTGEKEWGAQEEGKDPEKQDDKETDTDKNNEKEKKKEINEMQDKDFDEDQIDPYHGQQQPEPEPEPFDLPDDLQLDEGEAKDQDENVNEENPFDIDTMKEQNKTEEEGENEDDQANEEEKKPDDVDLDSSDDEDDNIQGEGQTENIEEEKNEDEEMEQDEQTGNDGGKKDEDKSGEEQNPEQDIKEDEIAKPSEDEPTAQQAESADQASGSKDEVAQQPDAVGDKNETQPDDSSVSEGQDKQGVGQSQSEKQSQAGHGGSTTEPVQSAKSVGQEEKRQRPGDTEDDRALGDLSEPLKKKMKTMNIEDEKRDMKETTEDEGIKEDSSADLYQHITEAKKLETDIQVMDAATKEQSEKQSVPNKDEETGEEIKEDDDVVMLDEDEAEKETEQPPTDKSDKLPESSGKESKDGQKANADGKDIMEVDSKIEVEGDVVQTEGVSRSDESTFHTKWDELKDSALKKSDIDGRMRAIQEISTWTQPTTSEEASDAWSRLNTVVSGLASELSEQLRLVLEPTTASRLKGDFRTGRRINMRKVIPYIASQFRKDKIWLRRTKPSKRDYQIVLAIDDSSSMADNHSKELAFESLALVSKALTLLEVGKLAVVSFGETPQILHSLDEPFTDHSGARLVQQLLFEQQKTQVGSLVDYCSDLLMQHKGDNAQLLVIVSDGRGVFNEGEDKVRAAVRRARLQGIFMVFIIIDSPKNTDSILDIRMPKFSKGKLLEISTYMDNFPFPFYLILRDINGLPLVLSDALRQWFELVANLG